MNLKELECLRCGWKWWPRPKNGKVEEPKTCPNPECRSPYWDRPRKDGKKG